MRLLRSLRRHWKMTTLGLAATVVALVVGGPYIYIHFIEGSPPAALALPTLPTSSTVGGAAGRTSPRANVAGSWTVGAGSRAGYRIKETLFGQSTTAVGRTGAITGTINIAATTVTTGTFTVDLTKVTSNQSGRDSQFQGRIMNTAKYPTATFTLTQPIQLGALPAVGTQVTAHVTGTLTMHGTTKSVTFTVTAQRSATTVQVSGAIPITFADYNISNPSGGPATTEDHGILEFLLTFTRR